MSNQRRTIGRNMGHLLNFWTWSQAMDRKCPSASAKGPNFGVSLPVPVWESRQGPADRQVSSRLVADIGTVPLTTVAIFWRARIRAVWSGARDLNPGPHGPESHDSSSKHVGFCVFQFDSSSRRARSVQICTNLQPNYYMNYYMDCLPR